MMGMMLLIASFIIGIVLATLSYDYWNHSIATQLNPSTSNLLADLGTINAVKLWLEPFKFVGMALLLTGRKTRTLPVAAAGFITDTGVEWGLIMAMGTLIVIPPLLFTFFSARQIITGMTAGAVKG